MSNFSLNYVIHYHWKRLNGIDLLTFFSSYLTICLTSHVSSAALHIISLGKLSLTCLLIPILSYSHHFILRCNCAFLCSPYKKNVIIYKLANFLVDILHFQETEPNQVGAVFILFNIISLNVEQTICTSKQLLNLQMLSKDILNNWPNALRRIYNNKLSFNSKNLEGKSQRHSLLEMKEIHKGTRNKGEVNSRFINGHSRY